MLMNEDAPGSTWTKNQVRSVVIRILGFKVKVLGVVLQFVQINNSFQLFGVVILFINTSNRIKYKLFYFILYSCNDSYDWNCRLMRKVILWLS